VLRGGGWVDSKAYVRYDFRFLLEPGDRDFYNGFRVLRGE
jgi:formylglycine-generating enzyme required for sulfatase activity